MNRISRFLLRYTIGAVLFIILTFGIAHYEQNFADRETDIPLPENNIFPKNKYENQHGQILNYEDFKGQVVIIDFWFGGCKPCLEEMIDFPELLEKYKDQFVILSYSFDSKSYTTKLLNKQVKVWQFLPKDNPNWHFFNVSKTDKNELIQLLGINAYPTYFLINQEGKVDKASVIGTQLIDNQFESFLFQTKSLNNTFKFYKDKLISVMFVYYQILVILVLLLQTIVFGIRRYVFKQKIRF